MVYITKQLIITLSDLWLRVWRYYKRCFNRFSRGEVL